MRTHSTTRPPHNSLRPTWRRGLSLVAFAFALPLLGGCGGEPDEDAMLEFELAPARPLMSEIDLGAYVIPVPGQTLDEQNQVLRYNYLQLEFMLFGVVEPREESEATRLATRHRGELRDRVIQVCRNTTTNELNDTELLTLKLRLIDAIQPVFEGVSFETVLLNDLKIESL